MTAVVRPTVAVLGSPSVTIDPAFDGLDGPVIFAPNHLSHADTPVVLAALPSEVRKRVAVAAAADNFFTNPVTSSLSALLMGAIPMERTKVARRSLDTAADLLGSGWHVLLYPEGTRSPDGSVQEFKGGAAYLALRCGVPVVPVHVTGTNLVLPKGSRLPRRARCTVTIGAPVVPHDGERARGLTARIHDAVASLGPHPAGT